LLFSSVALCRDYHVSKKGNDNNTGSKNSPFLTINRAAIAAKAGDNLIVHSGTYREWVNPPHGGNSDKNRITYMAAKGEDVIIKGSECIKSWVNQGKGVWKAELNNFFFNGYNPYQLQVKGSWMRYGDWHHRGAVYLNGCAFHEKASIGEVNDSLNSWYAVANKESTEIYANFGKSDPNNELTEINVRECIIFPDIPRLKYITIKGFTLQHAAPNWAPPGELQKGAVGPNFGYNWIIENCIITDSRCIGISIGFLPGIPDVYPFIDSVGHHIICNNIIKRCGQSGIAGHNGCMASEIFGNLIENTNYLMEFGGWETAALKFHKGIDMYIHNNCIRYVYKQGEGGAYGIWIDTGTQGMRISSNVIIDYSDDCLYFEANHGPILIDNNILIGGGCHQRSEAGIFVHNLFIDCPPRFSYENFENDSGIKTGARLMEIYQPHTATTIDEKSISLRNDRWLNNVFVKEGLKNSPKGEGYQIDYNVYLDGAQPTGWADEYSIIDTSGVNLNVVSNEKVVEIAITIPQTFFKIKNPFITSDYIGKIPLVNQGIETHNGIPISIDKDFFGKNLNTTEIYAGPFSNLKGGRNTYVLWDLTKQKIAQTLE
jgi:alpha-N-arabinofuranosidase